MDQNRANQVRGLLGRIKQDGLTSLRQRQRSAEGKEEDQLRELLDLGGTEATMPLALANPDEEEPELSEPEIPPLLKEGRFSRPVPSRLG